MKILVHALPTFLYVSVVRFRKEKWSQGNRFYLRKRRLRKTEEVKVQSFVFLKEHDWYLSMKDIDRGLENTEDKTYLEKGNETIGFKK